MLAIEVSVLKVIDSCLVIEGIWADCHSIEVSYAYWACPD